MKSNTKLVITIVAFIMVALTIVDCAKYSMKKSEKENSNNIILYFYNHEICLNNFRHF